MASSQSDKDDEGKGQMSEGDDVNGIGKVPASRWAKLANEFAHSSTASTEGTTFGSFYWKDVPFNMIPTKRKSDDLCAVLLAEVDRSAMGLRDPAHHFMSKYDDKSEDALQDLLICSASHWLLSSTDADFKMRPSDLLERISGIVGDMAELPWNADRAIILIPSCGGSSTAQVHQLIREMVVGTYVFNQIPELDLVTNFERSTTCHLSPAYRDTTVGQAMIDVAYAAGCLRFGGHFSAGNRRRFAGEWRSRLSVDASGQAVTKRQILLDFLHSGLHDVTQVSGYGDVYDGLTSECLSPPADSSDFHKFKESASSDLHFSVKQVYQHGTVFLTVPDVDVVGRVAKWAVDITDGDETREHLRVMAEVVQKNLQKNDAVNRSLEKLKLVACLTPLLVAFKQRNKIPNLAYLDEALPRSEMMTERELPPLMSSADFANRCYLEKDRYFGLLGGVRLSFECPPTSNELPPQFDERLRQKLIALDEGELIGEETQDETKDGERPLPIIEIGRDRFCVVELKLENFLAKNCRKPVWANQLHVEMNRLRFKILPLTTTQLNERFRRIFGPVRLSSTSYDVEESLFVACKCKMASVVHALLRDVHADQLERQNADGWSPMHCAVINDAVHIVGQLQQLGLNVNTRRFMYSKTSDFGEPLPDVDSVGPTPLHLAARFGAVEAATNLLILRADMFARDHIGWSPIHYACYYDQMPLLRLLLLKEYSQMELTTDDRLTRTPLLLCAVSGSLQTMKFLLSNGCRTDACDANARNLVHLATLHSKIHILKHLAIHGHSAGVKVWHTLSEMVKSSDVQWQTSAIRSVGVLMTCIPKCFKDILDAGLPDQLVSLMSEQSTRLLSDIAVTLSTMSHVDEVQRSLVQVTPLKILVKLMGSDDRLACSKAALIVSHVAAAQLAKDVVGEYGGFPALSHLLAASDNDELLLSALKAVTSVCLDHRTNKDHVGKCNLVHVVVGLLLHSKNDDVRSWACSALMVIADDHSCNQSLVIEVPGSLEAIRHILMEQDKPALRKKAAEVLRILAQNEQLSWSESGIVEPTISLLKVLDLELKEEAAQALWIMAGSARFQRKFMAQRIGTVQIINMLMSKSEILVGTCCPLVSAVVYEDVEEQNKFVDEGGLGPLLRLVSAESSAKILEGVMRTLATLCLGVDYKGNKRVQSELSKQDLIGCLLPLFKAAHSAVQAEALRLIACLAINRLKDVDISVVGGLGTIVTGLLQHEIQEIRLCVAEALALFAYNKDWTWNNVSVSFEITFFDHFLQSTDERHQCLAAYLIALLGSMVRHKDKASCTVVGIEMLVAKLATHNDDIFILAVSLLCSLVRGRTGVADALVVLGLVELLLRLLNVDRRRRKCASTLACLSHRQITRRRLLSNCRRRPELYDTLVSSLPSGVQLSRDFIEEFKTARQKGLPSES